MSISTRRPAPATAVWFKPLDYIFVLRPTQFFPLWATMLSGYLHALSQIQRAPALSPAAGFAALTPVSDLLWLWQLPVLPMLWLTLNVGAIYVFNQIADKENDNFNDKLFFISHGEMPVWAAWAEGVFLTLLSLVAAWHLSMPFFLCIVASTFVGVGYNTGLMNRPVPAALMNFSGGIVAYFSGVTAAGFSATAFFGGDALSSPSFSSLLSQLSSLLPSLPYGLGWMAGYLLVTLPDREGDKKFGKLTFAVRYGVAPTLLAAALSATLSLGIAVAVQDGLMIAAMSVGVPLFWQVYWAGNDEAIFAPVKFSMLLHALIVTLYLPLFFFLILATFLACKLYYRYRFDIDYPTFKKRG